MIWITISVFSLIVVISLYTYRFIFFSSRNKRCTLDDVLNQPLDDIQYRCVSEHISRMSHIMERIPFEPVMITSFDGCKLYGRYYHVRDHAPLAILFHGYRSCAFRDCCGAHALSRKMGFNALVVDQRAHGNSNGRTISFGIKESHDCKYWIDYANNRLGPENSIVLFGLSMGAATVLMVTEWNLPDNVACIIADSPYSAPCEIIEKVCKDMHYPVTLCRPFIHLGARIFGRFNLNSCSAKNAVSHSTVPILLIHGEEDQLVPCKMSYLIAECCASTVQVHTFPGAGHGLCYLTDPVRYEKIIYDFLVAFSGIADTISDSFKEQYHNQKM